ncbi:hypothetical protein IIA95_00210 [Patescibacteria group bacterium]|nr:hypothetical protein [Patescibacteria group bacterium]
MKDVGLIIFLILVLVVGFIWLAQSGFLTLKAPTLPTIPADSSTPSADSIPTVLPAEENETFKINISRRTARSTDDPKKEYIEIRASFSNKKAVNITGWRLENRKGAHWIIPQSAPLAFLSRVNPVGQILLEPGAKAIIVSGKSPISVSFRLNQCMGYFNQFKEFIPSLSQSCFNPIKEPGIRAVNDACFDYVRTLPQCRTLLADIPLSVNNQCQEFISSNLTYAGCVRNHKDGLGFFAKEWRVYLEQSEAIWSNTRETIKLLDKNLHLITEISY